MSRIDDSELLGRYAQDILRRGPNRVVVNGAGAALSPKRAREEHGIEPDVIFIRDDGWSLGAPKALAFTAEAMWPKQWLGVLRRGSATPQFYRQEELARAVETALDPEPMEEELS